jgi:predicted transcriptional regulator
MSNQWRNNEISFINNEIVKLVSLYREEKDLSKRDQDLKKDIKELMDMMN